MRALLERRFRFADHGTTLSRDTVAGATTFVVMSYIIFLNPLILTSGSHAGHRLPFDGVVTSTCLVAGAASIAMGLFTNRAYALAPGLGLNAVVTYSLVLDNGLSYASAMGLIVLEGCVVTVLVLTGFREQVMHAIPLELKKAIAVGIGLFVAFIGLFNSGVVAKAEAEPVTLGRLTTWPMLVVAFGFVVTIVLRARGFRGDLLVGIIATTAFATLLNWATGYTAFGAGGVARLPDHVLEHGNWSLVGAFDFNSFTRIGSSTGTAAVVSSIVWIFALSLSDFFDTMGTLVAVGRAAGYLDERGELPGIRRPLLVDSLAAAAGGAVSASSATTYIESGAGVAVGGRTGWVSVATGLLFFPFLFLAPLVAMVPPQATAPALVVVGWLMMSSLSEAEDEAEPENRRHLAGIDFGDLAVGLPAALTIMLMPFTFSITNGIGFGFISYVLIRLARGEWRRVHPLMYAVTVAFLLYFLVPLAQEQLRLI
jgi:AGZA family xanthine/uracil permease-like MFS transporter